MRNYILSFTILLTLLISACKSEGVTYTPPVLEGEWIVSMTQTGGIAGINRHIEIKSDGNYIIRSQNNNEEQKAKLSSDRLEKLKELIATLEVKNPQAIAVCADCFLYTIEIQTGGKKMIFEFDDITLPDSGAGDLVMFLQKLFE